MNVQERKAQLQVLEARFTQNPKRHAGIKWSDVQARLEKNPGALKILQAMEATGGEPDVTGKGTKDAARGFRGCVEV